MKFLASQGITPVHRAQPRPASDYEPAIRRHACALRRPYALNTSGKEDSRGSFVLYVAREALEVRQFGPGDPFRKPGAPLSDIVGSLLILGTDLHRFGRARVGRIRRSARLWPGRMPRSWPETQEGVQMTDGKSPDGERSPDGIALDRIPSGESRWSRRFRNGMQIAVRLARFADDLARVWHDWTGGGPGRPTRW